MSTKAQQLVITHLAHLVIAALLSSDSTFVTLWYEISGRQKNFVP
jgi:hypothetical protein